MECHGHNVRNPPVEVRAQVKIDRPDSMKKFGLVSVVREKLSKSYSHSWSGFCMSKEPTVGRN